MPTAVAAPTRTSTAANSYTASPLAPHVALNEEFNRIMGGQDWRNYPGMYAMYNEEFRGFAARLMARVGIADQKLRDLINGGSTTLGILDGMGPSGKPIPPSELDQLFRHLATHSGRQRQHLEQQIAQEIAQARAGLRSRQQRRLNEARATSEPDLETANMLAAQSKVKPENRVLGNDLAREQKSAQELINEIEAAFTNTTDPQTKGAVAAMDNKAQPTERQLHEPSMVRERGEREL